MADYRIHGDDGHLYYMGVLRKRSQIPFNTNWIAANEQRYLWDEDDDIAREEDNGHNIVQDNPNDTPAVNINSEDEWDDEWTGYPLETRQSSGIISSIINLVKSIKTYFTFLKKHASSA